MDTEPDIVSNAVDVTDVSDEIDTNTENMLDTTINGILKTAGNVFNDKQMVVGNINKDETLKKVSLYEMT